MKLRRVFSIFMMLCLCFSVFGTSSVVLGKKVKKSNQVFFYRYTRTADKVYFRVFMPEKWFDDILDEDSDGDESYAVVLKKVTCKTSVDTFTAKGSKVKILPDKKLNKKGYETHIAVDIIYKVSSTGFDGDIYSDKSWTFTAKFKADDGNWVNHKFYFTRKDIP